MNHITREKKELKQLSVTDKKFKEKIKGLTKIQAYQYYKDHIGTYQYNTDETKAEFSKMNYKRCSFCTKYISEFNKEMTVEHIETKNAYLDPSKVADIEKYFCYHADGTISANKKLSVAEVQKAEYMIALYELDREDLNVERRMFFQNLLDDTFFDILKKRDKASQDIHFLAVFTYYKRRMENGKQGVYIGSDNHKKSVDGI